ncbi:hypothetical protein FVEG_08693 [Fusarium verticillioides 7600]|uniref:Uncharacterized protein n=1 Tax=Gibberella moniliformis (strain M3125 / FGSC 7600) TaxID=334819 RepID=W7MXH0_GIBM7|nr:hypothetical protein FVEG_08693 [Fusarium verticillioides 7600]EWG49077.1 hypothetical protein FVEG_08693 [Fusarium verticillioides 7600]
MVSMVRGLGAEPPSLVLRVRRVPGSWIQDCTTRRCSCVDAQGFRWWLKLGCQQLVFRTRHDAFADPVGSLPHGSVCYNTRTTRFDVFKHYKLGGWTNIVNPEQRLGDL